MDRDANVNRRRNWRGGVEWPPQRRRYRARATSGRSIDGAALVWRESTMTRDRRSVSATTLRAFCAAVLALSFSTAGWAASTVVYRCLDSHLGVVYTDVPCKDGAPFDVRPGEADPVAV